jgi:SpoVK/Ycf46/Vps4 family AAA+-type ATPase
VFCDHPHRFAPFLGYVAVEGKSVNDVVDEVESLTAARASAMAGNEPSDALRVSVCNTIESVLIFQVVNALLTQLDKLKHRKNALVMATSNLVKAIDCAFVDRADIIHFIGFPRQEALYNILRSSLIELMTKGVIRSVVRVATLAGGSTLILH